MVGGMSEIYRAENCCAATLSLVTAHMLDAYKVRTLPTVASDPNVPKSVPKSSRSGDLTPRRNPAPHNAECIDDLVKCAAVEQ
jgi:hypothetical protein